MERAEKRGRKQRTDLIQLDEERFRTHGAQRRFGRFAVWAVGFAEDGDGVVVDDLLRFGLGG